MSEKKEVVVISGGVGFLGSFVVKQLIGRGFLVVIIDKNGDSTTLESKEAVFIKSDITDIQAVEKASKEIKDRFGSVSAVIHAASAPIIRQTLLEESLSEFESQFLVNVKGAFNLFKYFCPIISAGGAIIGITSKYIEPDAISLPVGSYVPAKMALRGLLRTLSKQIEGIRVYAVSPAFMPGGLSADLPEKIMEFIKKKSEPSQITNTKEVSDVILKLIDDKSGSLIGRLVNVPGQTTVL